jgi:SAM-dependent methyltransferase
VFEARGGILRLVTADRIAAVEAFQRQYRIVRERDGYRTGTPAYYRMLPVVPRSDPRADEWRVRRESYAHLQQHVLPGVWQGPIRILDLGAGNGWLSHRLAAFGHQVVAVDLLDDDLDGLGVCRHYPVTLILVQADFDALPFAPSQFEVVVLNGALHYAPDPEATLRAAIRTMTGNGTLVVMDSPMFRHEKDGQAMVERQLRALAARHNLPEVLRPGLGFLTYDRLNRVAREKGLTSTFIPSSGSFEWRWRRRASWLRLGRAPASFGVWMAQ